MSEAHIETRLKLLSTLIPASYCRGKSTAIVEMNGAYIETRLELLSTYGECFQLVEVRAGLPQR